jgi:hypothetical protein
MRGRIRTLGPPSGKNSNMRSRAKIGESRPGPTEAWRGLVRPVHQLPGRSTRLRNLTAGDLRRAPRDHCRRASHAAFRRVITLVALAPLQLGQAIRLTQDPRAPWPSRGRQPGADFAKSCFALGPKAELNLGLCTRLPMPSGRQLATSRWRHVCGHPPASLTTSWIWGRLSTRSRNFRGSLNGLRNTSPPCRGSPRDRHGANR